MKAILQFAFIFLTAAVSYRADAQSNIINQYGPPTFTGGTVVSPSESFAVYQEQRAQDYPITAIQSIYPDPAKNTSILTLAERATKPVKLYIVNLNGTIVRTLDYDGGTTRLIFDVSDLKDGVYTIQVQEQGKSMQSIKLLKQE